MNIIQLQRLILLMLEGLSPLLGSLSAVKQEMKLQETALCSLDDLLPSLQKIRKLAGMCLLGRKWSPLFFSSDLKLAVLLFLIRRITGHAFEINNCCLGKWRIGYLWFHTGRGIHSVSIFALGPS